MSEFAVAILTHESTRIPFEQTISELLTQFFTSLGARLHTSILVEGLESTPSVETKQRRGAAAGKKRQQDLRSLTLVNDDGYLKEDVASTAQFMGQIAGVVIALCHGGAGNLREGRPVSLHFRCGGRDIRFKEADVYAKAYAGNKDAVTLHSVIGLCKLAILLSCCGDELVTDYVLGDRAGKQFPDLLICQAPTVQTVSIEIYMVLLMNLLDSELHSKPNPTHVYEEVVIQIKTIFQIVRLFRDDHYSFWLFLKQVGCITDNTDEKNRQELPYPRRIEDKSFFRVYGRACVYQTQPFQNNILKDFQNMRLIRSRYKTKEREEYVSHLSVPDLTFQYSQFSKLNCFLKRYHESMQVTAIPDEPEKMEQEALHSKLARLKCMAN